MKELPTNIIKAGLTIPLRWEISSNFSDSQKSHAEICTGIICFLLFSYYFLGKHKNKFCEEDILTP